MPNMNNEWSKSYRNMRSFFLNLNLRSFQRKRIFWIFFILERVPTAFKFSILYILVTNSYCYSVSGLWRWNIQFIQRIDFGLLPEILSTNTRLCWKELMFENDMMDPIYCSNLRTLISNYNKRQKETFNINLGISRTLLNIHFFKVFR